MARFKAIVAYDGTDYQGFQRLPNAPSVQKELETALTAIRNTVEGEDTKEPLTIIGAGRTDTGVHATGQVIAFDIEWRHSTDALLRALNVKLPMDIAVKSVTPCAPDFHPRFEALSRTYRYLVQVTPVRQPELNRIAWQIRPPKGGDFHVEAMNIAAEMLIGVHDFASFGKAPKNDGGSDSTIREMLRCRWQELPSFYEGRLFGLDISANAFLYRMVRTITGTLIEVGAGRLSLDQFHEIVQAKERGRASKLAPAHGLTLTEVTYKG